MERVKTFIQERLLPEEAEKLYQQGAKFEEIMMMYGCALREVQTKLEVLNDELSVRYNRNPIEFIKTRVKKPLSIVNKLQRRGLEVSIESMVENLNDVAGIRVICYFLDDITMWPGGSPARTISACSRSRTISKIQSLTAIEAFT